MPTQLLSTLVALMLGLLASAAPALGKGGGGGGDARVSGHCSKGASSQLRLQKHHGTIRVEFTVRRRHAGERWRVVLVHERRIAWRGTLRTRGSSGSFRLRRTIGDFDGPDQVTARASGPRGVTCEAATTLR